MVSSSIYSIYKATCKITGLSYIGFTGQSYTTRIKQHKIKSKNSDYKFYRAIREYGWNSFEWELLYQSYDKIHCLNVMEPHFITEYDSFKKGYNDTEGGGHVNGFHNGKRYIIMDPNGNTFRIENLSQFCKQNQLNFGMMTSVAKGSKKHFRHWQVRFINDTKPFYKKTELKKKPKTGKLFIVKDPNQTEYRTRNLKKFCDEYGLNNSHMYAVSKGIRKHHKGWHCQIA